MNDTAKQFEFGVFLGAGLLAFSLLFGSRFCRHGHPRPGPPWAQGWLGALGCILACLGLGFVGIGPFLTASDQPPDWLPGLMFVGNALTLVGLIVLGYGTIAGLEALKQPAPASESPFLRRVVAVLPPILGVLFFALYVLFGVR
jgi:hypothetical protein